MVYTISDKISSEPERCRSKMNKKSARSSQKSTNVNKDDFKPSEKWRIWKNVLVLGFAFMVHFTAFWGASNLQSTVNADESLGTFTLASIYGALLLSNIFLPTGVIKLFGCKWTIALSFLTYVPFIAAQFYPKFYTMIPAGLFVGLGGGPLWCAKCTYLSVVSEAYAAITGLPAEMVVTRFFGVFFMFYQFSQVWGNLISSAVLSSGDVTVDVVNVTEEIQLLWANTSFLDNVEKTCGANFCPGTAIQSVNPNLAAPPQHKIHLIAGIYIACMLAASLCVALGTDSLKRYQGQRTGSAHGLSGLRLLAVTLRQLANPYQLLILPITMFIGAEQAFLAADYSAAFISCGWGISNIGFVMVCFGVCNALAAISIGGIVKKVGRNPMMICALFLHIALLITLIYWRPYPSNKIAFFVVAGLWGVCDAIWLVQINALSGLLFPGKEEAAYSNFRLWESTGSVITYVYNPFLCASVKIYILLGLLILGICGYVSVEVLESKTKKRNKDVSMRGRFELVNDRNEVVP